MDEPTNHLDLTTREALSMALNEFEGTVMLVSHDRALLREVCDEFWLVADGAIKPFDGDLDDYQRWLLDRSRDAARERAQGDKASRRRDNAAAAAAAASAPIAASAPVASPAPAAIASGRGHDRKASAAGRMQRSNELKPLRKELAAIDIRVAALQAERSAAEALLGAPGTGPAQRAEQGKRLKQLTADIDALEARWLELSTRLDAMTAQPD
jgi:ATP-binding cassette subfamily F protein 3